MIPPLKVLCRHLDLFLWFHWCLFSAKESQILIAGHIHIPIPYSLHVFGFIIIIFFYQSQCKETVSSLDLGAELGGPAGVMVTPNLEGNFFFNKPLIILF